MSKYVCEKYINFINKNGYIPKYFNAYNTIEVKDYCTTLSCNSGTAGGIGGVTIFEIRKEIKH